VGRHRVGVCVHACVCVCRSVCVGVGRSSMACAATLPCTCMPACRAYMLGCASHKAATCATCVLAGAPPFTPTTSQCTTRPSTHPRPPLPLLSPCLTHPASSPAAVVPHAGLTTRCRGQVQTKGGCKPKGG